MTVEELRLPVVAIVGPTAVGKTAASIEVARARGDCEIVNADSMQLYRGLDIGTGKVPTSERGGIVHHLLDIWPLQFQASVALYQQLARDQIRSIVQRGRVPLLVGGSGLYVSAVLDDLQFPGTDPQVRAHWQQQLDRLGPEALHEELARRDPAAALAILPGNGRRIVRALEVIEMTGQPFTARLGTNERYFDAVVLGLELDRPQLDNAIESRVGHMWRAGWVGEVERLLDDGLADAPTASRALGYQQILQYFDGSCDEAEARESTLVATRRFARRQLAWFRRDEHIEWFDVADPSHPSQLLERITRALPR